MREIVRQAEWYGIEELRERGKEKGDFEPDFHRKEIESLLKPPGIVQGTMARHAAREPEYRSADPPSFQQGDRVQHLSPSFHGKGVVHDVHPQRGVGVTWDDEGGFGGGHQSWEHPGDLRNHGPAKQATRQTFGLKPSGIVQGTMARHAEEGLFSVMDDPRYWTKADPTVSMMFEDDQAPGH